MSFLYRFAVTVTRQQPYIDWANSFDDGGPELSKELADDRRTVYLVNETDVRSDLRAILDEHWLDIFEKELGMWMEREADWPAERTREMFDAWFGVEVTDTVVDLAPEEPLTQLDVESADLDQALHYCAWCDLEVEAGDGRFVGFKLANRSKFAHRAGLTLALPIDEERIIMGIVSPGDSKEALDGDDLVVRACTSRCEKAIRKVVPKALKRLSALSPPRPS